MKWSLLQIIAENALCAAYGHLFLGVRRFALQSAASSSSKQQQQAAAATFPLASS